MTELTANPQYQHKTQWLNSTDGYLVLDKHQRHDRQRRGAVQQRQSGRTLQGHG